MKSIFYSILSATCLYTIILIVNLTLAFLNSHQPPPQLTLSHTHIMNTQGWGYIHTAMFKQDSRTAGLPPPPFPSSLVAQVCLTLVISETRKNRSHSVQLWKLIPTKQVSHRPPPVRSFSVFKYSLTQDKVIVICFYLLQVKESSLSLKMIWWEKRKWVAYNNLKMSYLHQGLRISFKN